MRHKTNRYYYCTVVLVRIQGTETAVASVYVRPNSPWDPRAARILSTRLGRDAVICGDFNAHHEDWGSHENSKRGQELIDAFSDLFPKNDGQFTFARRDGARSSIDVSFVTSTFQYKWSRAPDSCGCDHFPIYLTPTSNVPQKKRSYKINWATFRTHAADISPDTDFSGISDCLKAATRTHDTTPCQPAPDIKLLNLRAARRQAQRRAIRTRDPTSWNAYNRLDAACRRHAKARQRQGWASICSSIENERKPGRSWRIVKSLIHEHTQRSPIAAAAIRLKTTTRDLLENLADLFAKRPRDVLAIPDANPLNHYGLNTTPAAASLHKHFSSPALHVLPNRDAERIREICNAPITLSELRTALNSSKRRSAPRPDGVSYQALRNLDTPQVSLLRDALNKIWLADTLPPEWLLSIIIPILKKGKPGHKISSCRPIALTSAIGKILGAIILKRLELITI